MSPTDFCVCTRHFNCWKERYHLSSFIINDAVFNRVRNHLIVRCQMYKDILLRYMDIIPRSKDILRYLGRYFAQLIDLVTLLAS